MSYSIPEAGDIKSMLGMLYDGVGVKETAAKNIAAKENLYGVYVDDQNVPVALVVADVAFGAYSSSALTMVPPPVAKEAVKAGKLEEVMIGNLGEVMNILSRMFMKGHEAHLRFAAIHAGADLPEAGAAIAGNPGKQGWFEVDMPRYGSGVVGFVLPA